MSTTSSSLPRVTLVGRPNVGKSTLFNRLVGKRQAIVAEIAGTTRDRLEQVVTWKDQSFLLTDIAGLEVSLTHNSELARGTQAQVEKALQTADLLVWVVDGAEGVTPADQMAARILRKTGRPVLIAVNKCDHENHDDRQFEFSSFGFNQSIPISALNRRGIDELLSAITEKLPKGPVYIPEERELRISIVGRPNVGKSTLLNALTGDTRAVVSQTPGTTRDVVDSVVPAESLFDGTFTQWKTVRIIDTAGVRRRGKIGLSIEKWSLSRTLMTVENSEVVLFLIDAMEGMVHQDLQIAQEIIQAGRAVILVVNKWDLVLDMKKAYPGTPEDLEAQEIFLNHLRQSAPFLAWIQVLFLSAKDRLNIQVLGMLILKAYAGWNLEIEPAELNKLTKELRHLPRLKNLMGITLESNKPPVFHLHVEGRNLPHFSTVRYVENIFREIFPIGPSPIKIWSVTSIEKKKHRK